LEPELLAQAQVVVVDLVAEAHVETYPQPAEGLELGREVHALDVEVPAALELAAAAQAQVDLRLERTGEVDAHDPCLFENPAVLPVLELVIAAHAHAVPPARLVAVPLAADLGLAEGAPGLRHEPRVRAERPVDPPQIQVREPGAGVVAVLQQERAAAECAARLVERGRNG